jgi:transcriptional regulator with XRE-family HTH domain
MEVLSSSAMKVDALSITFPDAERAAKQLRLIIKALEEERAKSKPSRKVVQWMAGLTGAVILTASGGVAKDALSDALLSRPQGGGVTADLQHEIAECIRVERQASTAAHEAHVSGSGDVEASGTSDGGMTGSPKELGELVTRLRKEQAISQKELGARSGMAGSTISRIEAGQLTAPMLDTLRGLADGLGVPLADLTAALGPSRHRRGAPQGLALRPVDVSVETQPLGMRVSDDDSATVTDAMNVDEVASDEQARRRASGLTQEEWEQAKAVADQMGLKPGDRLVESAPEVFTLDQSTLDGGDVLG